MPIKDSFIAATALAHDLAVVTLNRRDFDAAGVIVVDSIATRQTQDGSATRYSDWPMRSVG
jgi:hypothetical protein